MSTDAEKRELIGRFEGVEPMKSLDDAIGGEAPREYWPEYQTDLNATMRAARRLPKSSLKLNVAFAIGSALCRDEDPARAAFEALAAYLENSGLHR